ncbi:hypothetical protein [Glycomyces sp. NRRL B-16210]|uniref:hypothetical protein n=1 Tax=Glycomyces sp. NRRL B-16210 TaxID=1463821 RepID=UPI0004C24FB5|nr:hypothetical protein [Glycomyces sp. NRRL B-16210]
MSYNQLPPPPPDRMHLQHQPAPQLAGPGGAYGPIEVPSGQPIPGQLPPPEMTMAKPGTITGIQVILWIFAVLAALADLGSVVSMVEFFNPLSLIGLAFAVYSTIQSVITPVQITRGKRWAWIWAVVNAILGLVIALGAIVLGVSVIDATPLPLLVGVVLGGLYGTLLGLLCSKSARSWILMHQLRRGEFSSIGTPGPGAVGVLVELDADRPEFKPGRVTAVQVLLWLAALSPLVMVYVFLTWASDEYRYYERNQRDHGSSLDYFFSSEWAIGAMWLVIGTLLLAVLAIISAVGLQRGRFWARVYTPIWAGLCLIAAGVWTLMALVLYLDAVFSPSRNTYEDPGNLPMLIGSALAFLALLIAFIMVFTRPVREWAPGKQLAISYEPGAQGMPLPGQPVAASGPYAQQGYAGQQGHPGQQGHSGQQNYGGPQGNAGGQGYPGPQGSQGPQGGYPGQGPSGPQGYGPPQQPYQPPQQYPPQPPYGR